MTVSKKKLDYRSPDIAKNAMYTYFNRDHHRVTTSLTTEQLADRKIIQRAGLATHSDDSHFSKILWKDLASQVVRMRRFVREVIGSDDPGFECEFNEIGQIVTLAELPLGQWYFDKRLMAGLGTEQGPILTRYRLEPCAQLFVDTLKMCPSGPLFTRHPAFRSYDTGNFLWEDFNALIDGIREEAKNRGLAQLDQKNVYEAKRRFRSMMNHIRRCFRKRRRLFVLRLDLDYRSDLANDVSVDLAKEHHRIFVNRLRAMKAVQDEMVGGVWKLEYGGKKGHHFHWIFLLDGSLVRDAAKWAGILETEWKKVVPQDAGFAHVCNYDDHEKVGTGMIHIEKDVEVFRVFEEEVVGYLAKKGQWLELKATDGAREWGRFTPSRKRKRKRTMQQIARE